MQEMNGLIPAPENKPNFEGYDIYRGCSRQDKRFMDKQMVKNTIKYHSKLTEEILPKMDKLTFEEDVLRDDGTVERLKPRKATMQEKNKLLFVMANRQAKLQAQIDWLKNTQEKYRMLKGE